VLNDYNLATTAHKNEPMVRGPFIPASKYIENYDEETFLFTGGNAYDDHRCNGTEW
jgi:hypothetical protein